MSNTNKYDKAKKTAAKVSKKAGKIAKITAVNTNNVAVKSIQKYPQEAFFVMLFLFGFGMYQKIKN